MLKRNSISTITGDRGGNERFGNFYERKKKGERKKRKKKRKIVQASLLRLCLV